MSYFFYFPVFKFALSHFNNTPLSHCWNNSYPQVVLNGCSYAISVDATFKEGSNHWWFGFLPPRLHLLYPCHFKTSCDNLQHMHTIIFHSTGSNNRIFSIQANVPLLCGRKSFLLSTLVEWSSSSISALSCTYGHFLFSFSPTSLGKTSLLT